LLVVNKSSSYSEAVEWVETNLGSESLLKSSEKKEEDWKYWVYLLRSKECNNKEI